MLLLFEVMYSVFFSYVRGLNKLNVQYSDIINVT